MFCEDFVGEENGDGGAQGFTVAKRAVCKACLSALKYRLNSVESKSPTEREQRIAPEDEDDEKEASSESNKESGGSEEESAKAVEDALDEEASEEKNPFSAKAEP